MNLLIFLDAFKIHKLRHERTVQLWFVVLYVINLLPLVLPIGDKDFSALVVALESMLAGDFSVEPAWILLTPGNWLVLGLQTLTSLITAFFSLMYATLFIGEKTGQTPREAFKATLAALPRLLLLAAVLLLPAMLSVMLAFIPLIIFVLMMYFLPLTLTLERCRLLPAMQMSYEATKRHKLFIFFMLLVMSFVLQLPQNLISNLVRSSLAYFVMNTFFIVLQALVNGRLMGILYLHLVKKEPFVLPSKSDASK